MKTSIHTRILLVFLLTGLYSFGQDEEKTTTDHEDLSELHHHSISLLLSHTIIKEGFKGGEKSTITVPSWAINYNYMFNEKWAIGLHNDIIIEDFIIEKNNEETLERSRPIASLIVGTYKITHHLGVELGGGMEFEENENFGLARIGAEYSIEIPKMKMEVLFAIDYDIVFDGYDSFNIGIGIAKLF